MTKWYDAPIIDWAGRSWRISVGWGGVVVNAQPVPGILHVQRLVYMPPSIFAQTLSKEWWVKSDPAGPWMPSPDGPVHVPPPPPGPAPGPLPAPVPDPAPELVAIASDLAATHRALDAGIGTLASGLVEAQAAIAAVLSVLTEDRVPVAVRFAVPYAITHSGKRIPMTINIVDDAVTVIPIEFDNVAGSAVPAPAGGTGSVSIDNTANFSVALSTTGPLSVLVTPVQPPTDGATGVLTYTDTLADGTSLSASLPDLIITANANATSVHFRTDSITTQPLTPTP